jgi:hypothetical protein
LKNHTLLIHSGSVGGSNSDLSSSSLSSLNSTQQLSDSASSPPLGITLKNSINLVAIKTSKSASNGASTSKGNKESGKDGKIPKLTPMKGYDGLGILTPATSPKNQQQQQQQLLADSGHVLNGSSSSSVVENIPLTPVSPASSPSSSTTSNTSYQQLKKPDS